MDHLTRKFESVSSAAELKTCDMVTNYKYFILLANRSRSSLGSSIQLVLEGPEKKTYLVYLPKKYSVVFTNKDLTEINNNERWMWIIYRGVNDNGYQLRIS
jgi:hypothetical protein